GWQVSRHENNVIIWTGDTAAHEPAVFQTKIVLPPVNEGGGIMIQAGAFTELTGSVTDMLTIYFTNKEGEVYYLGTPLPITRTSNYPTPDPLTTLTTTPWPTSATETIIPTPPPAATQQTPPPRGTPTQPVTYPIDAPSSFMPTTTPVPYP
ncbi:MAG: hypothetical protein WA110_01850, partial [Anaerolineaceae bacterium]